MRIALALLACLTAATPVLAQVEEVDNIAATAEARAEEARGLAERAVDLDTEAQEAETRIAELAADVAALEGEIAAARHRLTELSEREIAAQNLLLSRRDAFGAAFNAMVAFSKTPRPAIFAHMGEPAAAARGGSAMAGLSGALAAEAEMMNRALADIRAARIEAHQIRLDAKHSIDALRREDAALQDLIISRRDESEMVRTRAGTLDEEAERLAGRASALRTLLRDVPMPQPNPRRVASVSPRAFQAPSAGQPAPSVFGPEPITTARGRMAVPVSGVLSIGYGGALPDGSRAEGALFQSVPNSRVYAPWAGTIRYAGPLRPYGEVVIIDTADGARIILAGLGQSDRAQGERIMRGEPVGRMAGPLDPAAAANGGGALYFELQLRGNAVDPAPWLEPTI